MSTVHAPAATPSKGEAGIAWFERVMGLLGRRFVIGVPFVFLMVFFALPFLVVFKISVSEMENVIFKDLVTFKDGLTFLVAEKEYRRDVPVAADVAALLGEFERRRPEMASTGDVVTVVLDEARQAPGAFLRFTLIKAARSWYGIDSRTFEGPTLALQAVYLLLVLGGNAAVFLFRRPLGIAHLADLQRMLAGNWLIVGYFWAMTMAVVPLLRYMLPLMGPLFIALPAVYYALRSRLVGRVGNPPLRRSTTN